MFHRILVPLDGSTFSESALPAALSLAEHTGGEVHLLRVLEAFPIFVFPEVESPDKKEAQQYLKKLAQRIKTGRRVRIDSSVREGVVTDEIAGAAREAGADLIVMSTHGRGGVSRAWLGSVTDRILHSSELPLLLIRPPEHPAVAPTPLALRRVVMPMDGSKRAEAGLPWAAALGQALDVPVELVQAIVYPGAPGVGWSGGAEIIATAEREARAYLEKLVQRLRADGVEAVQRVIRSPAAWELALSEADGDAIVITTRARSPLRRAFLGSVADKVVRGATGPVLVITPKAAARYGAGTRSK